ncbi:hypothetical protein [Streptomyces sp. DSM 15324]|uniref:hypothetical protein n=1 Tax=Streptomyces sp. DSM 15324 TaxID=1739111 RepID=UPI0007460E8D|nr:hypothetical protein [Streptomyces sp. DSM 15324]KUO12470.1 hypothetical protein AQJ58_09655 [Streptomyces sp. DSM 15324]
MSELTNLVAKLERQVREAEEAHRIADGVGEAYEDLLDEIRHISSTISELSWELDGHIADCDYSAVQRSVYEIRGATDADRLLPVLRQVLLLRALWEGATLPDPAAIESLPELPPEDMAHPTLTWEELRRDSQQELEEREASARRIWCDEDDEAELQDALDRARSEAIQDRATRAGRQLMKLCEYISEKLCPRLVTSAENGNIEEALKTLAAMDAAGQEAEPAYKVYEVALSEQYDHSPTSLGAMGEHLMLFESWLGTQ